MELIGLKTPILKVHFDLQDALLTALKRQKTHLQEGDVIVVSSKIIAIAEGRIVNLKEITPSNKAKKLKKSRYGTGSEDPRIVELALQESQKVFPGNMLLTLTNGILIPAAGIDTSNVPLGYAILWPKDSMKSASLLWKQLRKKWKIKKLGIVICDSHCQPLRWGTTGIALGWAGFYGVEDARGEKDIYGKKLHVTRKAMADNLASSALLLMGEAAEKTPFVLIKMAPVFFTHKKQTAAQALVSAKNCIFSGIYKNL